MVQTNTHDRDQFSGVVVAEPIPEGTTPDPTAHERQLDAEGKFAAENAKNNYLIPPKQEEKQ